MTYRQITPEERYMIAQCRRRRMSVAEMAKLLGRHPSSIYRELARNCSKQRRYRCSKAQEKTNGRRSRSRRNRRFGQQEWRLIEKLIREEWLQVVGAEYSLETGTVEFLDDHHA